jgi:GH35 family endo-1,4-beta-xylanase
MVALCRAIPSCDVNFFGFTDAYYWITFLNRDPLMFDPHYLAKPAFFGVRDALVGY